MDEKDAWSNFVATGSVLDYLKYSSIKNGNPQEAPYESQHGRTDNKRTDYKGTGQTCNRTDQK